MIIIKIYCYTILPFVTIQNDSKRFKTIQNDSNLQFVKTHTYIHTYIHTYTTFEMSFLTEKQKKRRKMLKNLRVRVSYIETEKTHSGSCCAPTGNVEWGVPINKTVYFDAKINTLCYTNKKTGSIDQKFVADCYLRDELNMCVLYSKGSPNFPYIGSVWKERMSGNIHAGWPIPMKPTGYIEECCCGSKIEIKEAVLEDKPVWMREKDASDLDSTSASAQDMKMLALEKENQKLQERVKELEKKMDAILGMGGFQ